MASFGHVAVGLLAGRAHGGPPDSARRRCPPAVLLAFAALAVLPDADVLLVTLGASDRSFAGHRGASHSFSIALAAGLLCAVGAWRLRWPVVRTALVGTLAVGSHALLDLVCHGGRGLPLLWPLSATRFNSPVRILPNAPRGVRILSAHGLAELATEFALFLPITMVALWPHLKQRWRGSAATPAASLTVVDGGGDGPPPAPADDRRDPPLRSSG